MGNNTKTKRTSVSGRSISHFFQKYGLLFFLILTMIVFGLLNPRFYGFSNIMSILTNASITAIATMGFVAIMSAGEIDFSIGMVFSLAGLIMLVTIKFSGLNFWVVLLFMLMCVTVFGLLNAFVIVNIGIPSFLATMGVALIINFTGEMISGGLSVTYLGLPKIVNFWGQHRLFGHIPMPIIVFIVVSVIMIIYTTRTKYGKKMYAVGSNAVACNFIGINPRRLKYIGFIICAILAGLAGFIQASLYNRANIAVGDGVALNLLAALLLSATFYRPGVYNIPGAIVGSILIAVIANGLIMVSAPAYMINFMTATVMTVAVSATAMIRKRSAKA